MFSIPITVVETDYTIHFPTKELKDEYIEKERYYTRTELEHFYTRLTTKERHEAKALLSKKQLNFAKTQSYKARTKGKPYDLYFEDTSLEDLIA